MPVCHEYSSIKFEIISSWRDAGVNLVSDRERNLFNGDSGFVDATLFFFVFAQNRVVIEPGRVAMKKALGISVLLLWCSLAPAVWSQNEAELQQKLEGVYTLTKMTADNTDIVTPGAVLVLHKDGLQMCSTQARVALKNNYKGDRLSAAKMSWSMEMGLVQPDLPTAQIPIKEFDSGDKFWVTGIVVDKNGVTLKVISDPYDDVRYWAQIQVPFDKKSDVSDDAVLKSVAELLTVDNGQSQSASGAQSQDPKELIKQRLSSTLVLTQGNVDTGEITKAGSIIDLRKDGLVMWTLEDRVAPLYVYRDGKLSMPFMLGAEANSKLHAKDPDLNRFNVPKRTFVAGEKFWIIDYKVLDSGVTMEFASDPYQDVRYIGSIGFPFDKKQPVPSPDDFMKTVAEVIGVEAPPAQNNAQSAPPPAAPAAPAQSTPAMAPIAPPAPPPKEVSLGQTQAQVQAILGQPTKVAVLGKKEIDYYPDMKVIYVDGKVSDIQ